MANYNHAAAFTAYAKGEDLDNIALALAIPVSKLKDWVRMEGWRRLAAEVKSLLPATVPEARAECAMAKIQANRDRNLELADKLRDVLARTVEKLHAGTLKLRRMTSKGEVIESEPTFRDLRDLAAFAKDVAELGYRALGDQPAPQREGGEGSAPGQITIVLPAPVAQPRQERAIDIQAEVVQEPKQLPILCESASGAEPSPSALDASA